MSTSTATTPTGPAKGTLPQQQRGARRPVTLTVVPSSLPHEEQIRRGARILQILLTWDARRIAAEAEAGRTMAPCQTCQTYEIPTLEPAA